MKNRLLELLIILLLISCVAPETAPHIEGKYERARQLGDDRTAIVYLHELLDLGDENYSVYRRLATCYYQTQNYAAAIESIDEILEEANVLDKKDMLLIKAKSYTELGDYTNAIGAYDVLIKVDKELALEYIYQMGVLYKAHGDVGSTILKMNQIVAMPLARLTEKEINSDQTGSEFVTYYQAALNFKAVVQMQAQDLVQAQQTYEQLFQEQRPFQLATRNYEQLKAFIKTNSSSANK
jgi:tetratricopeptide (TPR) repeat protein